MPGPLFAWLPDGKHVVTVGLAVLSVETGESTGLTSQPPNLPADFSPAVSPDGRTVAFGRSSGYDTSDLYLLDLAPDLRPSSKPRRLTSMKGRKPHSSLDTGREETHLHFGRRRDQPSLASVGLRFETSRAITFR